MNDSGRHSLLPPRNFSRTFAYAVASDGFGQLGGVNARGQ